MGSILVENRAFRATHPQRFARISGRALSDRYRVAAGAGAANLVGIPRGRISRGVNTAPGIIRLAVMTEARSPLTLRNVENLLRGHGID
jgi:hypothetical protein